MKHIYLKQQVNVHLFSSTLKKRELFVLIVVSEFLKDYSCSFSMLLGSIVILLSIIEQGQYTKDYYDYFLDSKTHGHLINQEI